MDSGERQLMRPDERPPLPRRRRVGRALVVAIAWLLAAAGTVLVLLGAFPELQLLHPAPAMAAAFIPYGVLAWLVVTAVLLTSRRTAVKALALLTVAALALQVGWTRPYWPHAPAVESADLTVMTLNTYYGWSDADQLVAEAERVRPDVVVLTEITDGTWDALQERGWTELLPHHVGEPGPGWNASATMVFSRHPLAELPVSPTSDEHFVLRMTTPDGPVTVIAVHAANPMDGFESWESDLATIRDEAAAHLDGPLVVLGDFNATREHLPLRELLDVGLSDAAEQAGTGWLPTYPSKRFYQPFPDLTYPSVIGLDHVLVGPGLTGVAAHTFGLDLTDHRGLVAELAVSGWSGT